ncbi:MAG: hypothetical protein F6K62_23625, partial [Sphaerospermopsis sp. SIO1G2]|nr:hypothetical protein [Sphaerospermopsis sp. SIO1G2]
MPRQTIIERVTSPWGTEQNSIPSVKNMFLLVLAVFGAGHWLWFLNSGDFPLTFQDWHKEALYLNTLREAMVDGYWPLQGAEPYVQGTSAFFAIPEVVLTPDIFLLPLLNNGTFIVLHLLIFYVIGFIGSVYLAK